MKKFIYIVFLGMFLSTLSFADVKNLQPETFYKKLTETKTAILLDVRTPYEYEKDGHIPNSNLIPIQVLPRYADKLLKYKDYPVFVYCRSGNRSLVAAKYLEKLGFKKVYNLEGGIIAWKRAGLPVKYGRN